jgi:hypothetical protein
MATVPQARKVCDLDSGGGPGRDWQAVDTSDTSIVIQERRAADGLDSYIPMILQGGEIYDPDLDRYFLDLPLNGRVRAIRCALTAMMFWSGFASSPPRAASLSGKPIPMMSVPIIVPGGAVTLSSGFRRRRGTGRLPRSTSFIDGPSARAWSSVRHSPIGRSGEDRTAVGELPSRA